MRIPLIDAQFASDTLSRKRLIRCSVTMFYIQIPRTRESIEKAARWGNKKDEIVQFEEMGRKDADN